jgi:hypothetical protein
MKDAEQREREQRTRRGLLAVGMKPEIVELLRESIWDCAPSWATTDSQKHAFTERGLERLLEIELAEYKGRAN